MVECIKICSTINFSCMELFDMKKNLIKILSLVCVITLLFSACGNGVLTHSIRFKELQTVTAKYSGDKLHKSVDKSYKSICKSGLIEMLFDESTCTVAIRDTNSGNLWTTLPHSSVSKQIVSSAIEVELSNGKETVYVLNSQDNSVAFGNVKYTIGENEILVEYAISLDAETGKANIDELKDEEIRADLSVLYTLRDGSFYVNVSMNKLKLPKGIYLEKIRLLKDFGSYEKSGSDDYIFIPDGSGALIYTGVEDSEFTPLALSVYGDENATCLVAAYGMKRENGAFLCIIEQGDSIAEINAYRTGENLLNSVYATFNTTEIQEKTSGSKTKKTYGYEYQNEITLCYRFLSGKSATYSGMATACRENLIRNSVLSTKTLSVESSHIPLVVSVQGGYINGKGKYTTLSDYEQTLSLMTLLKAKGVNNIYLRYNGLYEDANNGSNAKFGDFKKILGAEKEYNDLYTYINSQKFSLFIDTDILTFDGNGGAKSVDGSKLINNSSDTFPHNTEKQNFLKMSDLENKIENILNQSNELNFDGYSLNDIGAYLYSDYSSDFYARVSAKKEISAQLPILATSKLLMVDTGNFYSVKNADVISNIPVSPTLKEESKSYVSIPFVQLMLHGICEYSATGINTSDDVTTAFLKAVEYGCLPSADWYCTAFAGDLDDKYYYDNNINDIVTLYTKADSALSSLRDARMTSHYKVQDGVYCTEYNNSEKVYVNYTDKAVTISGITVNAKDCVAIS